MKLRNLGVLGGIAALTFAACNGGTATTAPGTAGGATQAPASVAAKGTLKIGIELPLSGLSAP